MGLSLPIRRQALLGALVHCLPIMPFVKRRQPTLLHAAHTAPPPAHLGPGVLMRECEDVRPEVFPASAKLLLPGASQGGLLPAKRGAGSRAAVLWRWGPSAGLSCAPMCRWVRDRGRKATRSCGPLQLSRGATGAGIARAAWQQGRGATGAGIARATGRSQHSMLGVRCWAAGSLKAMELPHTWCASRRLPCRPAPALLVAGGHVVGGMLLLLQRAAP